MIATWSRNASFVSGYLSNVVHIYYLDLSQVSYTEAQGIIFLSSISLILVILNSLVECGAIVNPSRASYEDNLQCNTGFSEHQTTFGTVENGGFALNKLKAAGKSVA